MREAFDDVTGTICLDPKHVGAYKFCAELYSRYDQFQNALQDSEMVLKLDLHMPNASCTVGFAHYALGNDAEGRQRLPVEGYCSECPRTQSFASSAREDRESRSFRP